MVGVHQNFWPKGLLGTHQCFSPSKVVVHLEIKQTTCFARVSHSHSREQLHTNRKRAELCKLRERGSRGADRQTRGAHCAPTAPNWDGIGDFHTWPGEMLEEVPPSPEGRGREGY